MHGAFLSPMIQGFFLSLVLLEAHEKELAQSKSSVFLFVVD